MSSQLLSNMRTQPLPSEPLSFLLHFLHLHKSLHCFQCRYFQSVVAVFEEKMELYRNQLLELESHLSAVGRDRSMSPQSQSYLSLNLPLLPPSLFFVFSPSGFELKDVSPLVQIWWIFYKSNIDRSFCWQLSCRPFMNRSRYVYSEISIYEH